MIIEVPRIIMRVLMNDMNVKCASESYFENVFGKLKKRNEASLNNVLIRGIDLFHWHNL